MEKLLQRFQLVDRLNVSDANLVASTQLLLWQLQSA
jgi:hypothetical protein